MHNVYLVAELALLIIGLPSFLFVLHRMIWRQIRQDVLARRMRDQELADKGKRHHERTG